MAPFKQRNAVSDVTGDSDPTTSVIPVGSADSNNSEALSFIFGAPIPGFSRLSGLVTKARMEFSSTWDSDQTFWFKPN